MRQQGSDCNKLESNRWPFGNGGFISCDVPQATYAASRKAEYEVSAVKNRVAVDLDDFTTLYLQRGAILENKNKNGKWADSFFFIDLFSIRYYLMKLKLFCERFNGIFYRNKFWF